jgi:hypothetical protein
MITLAATAVLATVLAGCQNARAGTRCRTTDFGQQGDYVLACRSGRWQRAMTKQAAAELILKIIAARTTTTTTPPRSTTPTVIGSLDVADQVVDRVHVAGWAIHQGSSAPVSMVYTDNGARAATGRADLERADLAPFGQGTAHGFSATFTVTPGQHLLCAWAVGVAPAADTAIGCRNVQVGAGS